MYDIAKAVGAIIGIFIKAYYTGLVTIMKFWWKIFGTWERFSLFNMIVGIIALVVFIVIAIKWGFLKAVWCTVVYTIALAGLTLGIGIFEIYVMKHSNR